MVFSLTEATPDAAAALPGLPGAWPRLTRWRKLAADVRRIARNPMNGWPADVFTAPCTMARVAGRDIAFLCDPALIRNLFIDHADLLVHDEGVQRSLSPALGRGILLADGAAWRWQRRAAAPVFRPARIDAYVPAMIGAARRTAASWQSLADGAETDLSADMMRLSFDIMASTMLSGETDMDMASIGRSLGEFLHPAPLAVLLSLLGAPSWLPYPGAGAARRACREARRAAGNLIERRRARHRDAVQADDLLCHLMAAASPGNGRGMADAELTDNLLSFIAAGHEPTALALFWLFQLLADAPDIESRLVHEIALVTGGGDLVPDMLNRLVYTRQVVNEALRLFPPTPAILRKVVRDVTIGPCRLRPGTCVILPIFAIHRHLALWQAPGLFDPDRFAPERAASRDRLAFIPFGLGPRSCIGMGFAMAGILAAVAVLAPRFALRRKAGAAPSCRQHISLRPDGNTKVIVTQRGLGRRAVGLADENQEQHVLF